MESSDSQTLAAIRATGWDLDEVADITGIPDKILQAAVTGEGRMTERRWASVEALLGLPVGSLPRPILVHERQANGLVNEN